MTMKHLLRIALALIACALLIVGLGSSSTTLADDPKQTPGAPGALVILGKEGKPAGACPLKHTDVKAEIAGFVARVDVVQEFYNPTTENIEAVYTFPLPDDAAVDRMAMKVGDRLIEGEIQRREVAQQIYQAAKEAGHVASLLDQERPNIFTQSVANIMPGEQVKITISYTQMLRYEGGEYEFVFPMVVGPRYIPGSPSGNTGIGRESDTDDVPDASKITPPITPRGTRAGQDISLSVALNAGVPLVSVVSKLHEVDGYYPTPEQAVITLKNKDEIPNRDFVLKYAVAGEQVGSGVITHCPGGGSGYFTLIVQPPKTVKPKLVTPKEMIFVLDTSGSQQGEPIKKSKETIFHCIRNLNQGDTFNVIAFSNQPRLLFDKAQPFNSANEKAALDYIAKCEASGGTEIIPALKPALETPADPQRLRIVVAFTDGYVGNDFAICDYIQKNVGSARVFSFGIGNSVNRFLLERMAEIGRGASDFVLLNSDGKQIASKFYDRIRNPILTDISVDWNGMPVVVEDLYPKRVPDLFGAQPLVIKGRYTAAATGEITVRANVAGKPWAKTVEVDFPQVQGDNDCLAPIWARSKIDDLMTMDWMGAQSGNAQPDVKEAIVDVALDYRLMTQYTSFVAVEKKVITSGGKPRTIAVPVDMPEGVSYEGIFGDEMQVAAGRQLSLGLGYGGYAAKSAGVPTRGSVSNGPVPNASAPMPATAGTFALEARADDADVEEIKPETPEQKRERLITSRLDSSMTKLLAGYKSAAGDPAKYHVPTGLTVKDGKVEVMIWVKDASPEKLAEFDKLGVTDREWALEGRILIARIPLDKLEDVAVLDIVARIAAPSYAGG